MKYIFFATIIFFNACTQQPKTIITASEVVADTITNQTKEKEAIMKVIESETECFFQRDYVCWKKFFVQSDYAFQAWNNNNGSIDAKSGWKDIDEKIKAYLTRPENKPVGKKTMGQEPGVKEVPSSHPKVIRKNILCKFFSQKLAYLMWDQYNSEPDEQHYMFSKECRIMEKINGEWKIANVTSYWDYNRIIEAASLE